MIVPVRGGVGDLASIYSLNELGSFLWRNLKTPKTAGELAGLVVDEYDVAGDVASRDVQAFLSEIKAARLIHETAICSTEMDGTSDVLRNPVEMAPVETR